MTRQYDLFNQELNYGETGTNYERSPLREIKRDYTASAYFRWSVIPGLRDLDIDMSQWNRGYTSMEICYEFTAKLDWEKKGHTALRALGAGMGAYSVLVGHKKDDVRLEAPIGVRIYGPDGQLLIRKAKICWEELREYQIAMRDGQL